MIPDLIAKGISDQSGRFSTTAGPDFVRGLDESYVRMIAENVNAGLLSTCKSALQVLDMDMLKIFDDVASERTSIPEYPHGGVGTVEMSEYAKGNDVNAQFETAVYWFKKRDLQESLKWARLAAESGSADAMLFYEELRKVMEKHHLPLEKNKKNSYTSIR